VDDQTTAPLVDAVAATTEPVLQTLNQPTEALVDTVATTEPVLQTLNQTTEPLVDTVATTEPMVASLAEPGPVAAEQTIQPVNETAGEPASPVVHTLGGNTALKQAAPAQPAAGAVAQPPSSTTPAVPPTSKLADATTYLLAATEAATEMTAQAHAAPEADSAFPVVTPPPGEVWMARSDSSNQPVGPFGIWRLLALPGSPSNTSGGMAELLERTLSTPPAALAWLFALMLGLLWTRGFFHSSTLLAIRERPG
jgi:hypothetical protein